MHVWVVASISLCVLWKNSKDDIYKIYTHHEEDAEVGQFSEEILHTDWVGVKGKIAANALVELLHVLVHRGQFFILLAGMLAEAVRTESREKEINMSQIQTKHT